MRVRKWLSLLVALAMVVSLLVVSAFAATHELDTGYGDLDGQTVTFTIEEDETIGRKVDSNGDVYIPFTISVESSGPAIPAFSFTLKPDNGLVLATTLKQSESDVYYYTMPTLNNWKKNGDDGAYSEFNYQASTMYFGAGGSDAGEGITTEVPVLTIVGKIASTAAAGDYTLSMVTDTTNKYVVVAGDGDGNKFDCTVVDAVVSYGPATVTVNVKDGTNSGAALTDATVKLMKGSTEMGTFTHSGGGVYTLANVAPGEYSIKATKAADPTDLIGYTTVSVAGMDVTAGAITVMQGIKGDVDGDGNVTLNDAMYLARCKLNRAGYVLPANADYTCDVDGVAGVTLNDAMYLARYKLNRAGYTVLH